MSLLEKINFTVIILLLSTCISISQNLPEFGTLEDDVVIINSGVDFIIIPNLSDGDNNSQQLNLQVSSSDETILKIDSVSYKSGNQYALIWVMEQGISGNVIITVSATDEDGTITGQFNVAVSDYSHHGVKFEIHDAVFWQEVIPLDDTPVFDSIVQSTNMKAAYDDLNWGQIPLTVSAGCDNTSLCDGHDFSTGFIKGFLAPRTSGNYTFYMNGDGDYALFLSSDENFSNAKIIASKSDNHSNTGSAIYGRKSGAISLEAGKIYAIYGAQWNIHNENGGIQWELPGEFSRRYIEGLFLYPEYDIIRPDVVDNIQVIAKGDNFIRISWEHANDDQKIAGYNVYLNGIRINDLTVSGTEYQVDELLPATNYSITLTAVDVVGNESFMSAALKVETFVSDDIAPNPPTDLKIIEVTGLAVNVSWSGDSDGESEVLAYNVYLNGELYNNEGLIYSDSLILKVLAPETSYSLEIEAIDAGLNISEKSEVFYISTTEFDPEGYNLGLKTGRLEFLTEAISFNKGIGINTDFIDGSIFNYNHTTLLNDLKPGAIRWGALTANPLSFSDYSGGGKNVTIGKFIQRCNDFGAFTAFVCGVENSTDWINDSNTFLRFLEYINGPDESPGGQLRVAEGYTEPFLKNSPGLIFEFGNEVWGANAHNAQIGSNYNNYAQWCRNMANIMRSSPYYDSTKIYLAYSSRYPSNEHSYGLNEKLIDGDRGEVDWTAPSGYLGGNLNYDPALPASESELEYYKNVRARADNYLQGMKRSRKYEVLKTGRVLKQYMYESNTTTPTYKGRLGQAILSTDYYLTSMELGSAIPTLFHLTGGQWRIVEPENGYRRLPLFITAKYFNNFCKGDVLNNTYYSPDLNPSGTGVPFNYREVGAHTYGNEKYYSIVLLSRDFENDHYVQIDLPDDLPITSQGKEFVISGEDYNTLNATIDSTIIDISDKMILRVPKCGMVILTIPVNDHKMTNLPLAFYKYPKIEKIDILSDNFTFSEYNETARFSVSIFPEDAWDPDIVWTLFNNSGEFEIFKSNKYCYVRSGDNFNNESDSLILRASNGAGDIYDEIVLYFPKSVDLESVKQVKGFNIFPNPAREVINIETDQPDSVNIYSLSGVKVFEAELEKGVNQIKIDKLPKGLYTVKVGRKTEILIIEQ